LQTFRYIDMLIHKHTHSNNAPIIPFPFVPYIKNKSKNHLRKIKIHNQNKDMLTNIHYISQF